MNAILRNHPDAVSRFNSLGWDHLKEFIGADTIDELSKELGEVMRSQTKNPEALYFYEVNEAHRKLNRAERIWESIPLLCTGTLGREIVELAEVLLDDAVTLFKDKVNIRYSGSKGYEPHQDAAAGWDHFAERFVSIGIFLEASDFGSGGFEIANSAHINGRLTNEKGKMSQKDFQALDPVWLTAQKGDVIVLDSETPHRTSDNMSADDKWHLLFTFAKGHHDGIRESYYTEKKKSFLASQKDNTYEFRVFKF